jgi:DNA-binding LacI/PurR family transcriptional regulator
MAARTPRIKDIAAQLGVSVATVSRALNDKPGVAPDLRRRVLALAAELDFTPNVAARSLNGAHTGAIAFVVHQQPFPAARDPFYYVIMHGVERALAEEGYHIILTTVGAADERQAGDLRVVRESRVDGLILAGPDVVPALILSVAQRPLPLVLVDNALERTPLDCVLSDNCEGARTAVEHLLGHGHRRIAFVGGPPTWLSTRERQEGFERALTAAPTWSVLIHQDATTIATGVEAGRMLFAAPPQPTAVFAVNDAMALGVIRAARDAGLRVPQDVAVIGFDDIPVAETADPPLTTVHIAKERMGELAARHLLERIRAPDPAPPPTRLIVGTSLILRASCGCEAA